MLRLVQSCFWFYRTCDSCFDYDGDIGGTELAIFIVEFGNCSSDCLGDLEGDDCVDEQDIVGSALGFGDDYCHRSGD